MSDRESGHRFNKKYKRYDIVVESIINSKCYDHGRVKLELNEFLRFITYIDMNLALGFFNTDSQLNLIFD